MLGLNKTFAIALLLTFAYSYTPPSLKVTRALCLSMSTSNDLMALDVRDGTVTYMLGIMSKVNSKGMNPLSNRVGWMRESIREY